MTSIILLNLFGAISTVHFQTSKEPPSGSSGDGEISSLSLKGGLPPHVPVFNVSGSSHTNYLKSIVTTIYDGAGWSLPDTLVQTDREYYGGRIDTHVKRYSWYDQDQIQIIPIVAMSGYIPTSMYPQELVFEVPQITTSYFPDYSIFFVSNTFELPYRFQTIHYTYLTELLRQAEVIENEEYLQLPNEITDRTFELALSLTNSVSTPYEKIKNLEQYLQEYFEYDVEYTRSPDGWEPNDWFLFEEKKGVCANFNSALTVLARCVGIPARFVGGYLIEQIDEMQTVFADQAHAWTEIGFKNLGWITMDATGRPDWHQTLTNISSIFPSRILKGNDFWVSGTVLTNLGNPVERMDMTIYGAEKKWSERFQWGNGTAVDGAFNITCQVPQDIDIGNYQVIAVAKANSKYATSESDPIVTIASFTEVSATAPDRVLLGKYFMVKGNLQEDSDVPVSTQTVDIQINHANFTVLTNEEGEFEIIHSLLSDGNYSIDIRYSGSEFYDPSNKTVYVKASTIEIQSYTNSTLIRSEIQNISGKAFFGESELAMEEFQIWLGDEIIGNPSTDQEGLFNTDHKVANDSVLGPTEISYNIPRFDYVSNEKIVIKAKTHVNLSEINDVKPGDSTIVLISLLDDLDNPISNAEILVDNQQRLTDESGSIAYAFTIPEEYDGDSYSVNMIFDGTEEYLPSTKLLSILLKTELPEMYFMIVLFLAGAIGLTIAMRIGLLDRFNRKKTNHVQPRIIDMPQTGKMNITIQFPDIVDPLPNIWGIDKYIKIQCKLINKNNVLILGKKIDIMIDKETIGQKITEKTEKPISHLFTELGEYQVICQFNGDNEFSSASSERTLKVVDYREEIVSLYNQFITKCKLHDEDIKKELTPREIKEKIVRNSKWNILLGDLNIIIRCFEEAQYSVHPIDRENYVKMFLAKRRVEEVIESIGQSNVEKIW